MAIHVQHYGWDLQWITDREAVAKAATEIRLAVETSGATSEVLEPTQPKPIEDDMHLQQKIREFIDREGKTYNGRENAYFGFVYQNGTISKTRQGPCHGGCLRHGAEKYGSVLGCVKAIITKIDRTGEREQSKHTVEFYDWLFNRSPFADVFMYKSAQSQFDQQWTALRTNKPANLVQSALITSRNTWEYKDKVDLWKELKDRGVNENFAYFVTHFISKIGMGEYATSTITADHTAVGYNATVAGAYAYTHNTGINPDVAQKNYDKGGTGHGVHACWHHDPEENIFSKKLKDELKAWLAGGEKRVETNVFHKAKPKKSEGTVVVSLDQLAKFLNERQGALTGEE